MKSHANLWPRVTSFENLYEAFRAARKGKRGRPDVAAFEFNLESKLLALQRELLSGTYRPGGYRHFVVREPVERKISAAPFRDRVVHHALCRVVEPLFERVFLPHSFANRLGKGSHRAMRRWSWNNNPINLRTANRNNNTPDNRNNNIGFRCASESPSLAETPSLHGGRLRRGETPRPAPGWRRRQPKSSIRRGRPVGREVERRPLLRRSAVRLLLP